MRDSSIEIGCNTLFFFSSWFWVLIGWHETVNRAYAQNVLPTCRDFFYPKSKLHLCWVSVNTECLIVNPKPKRKKFIIYSPSCGFKPVWLSFFCETEKEIFWIIFWSIFFLCSLVTMNKDWSFQSTKKKRYDKKYNSCFILYSRFS